MADNELNLFYRKPDGEDGLWTMTTVGDLRECLSELPDSYELIPNGLGNLAVFEWGESKYGPEGTRWYIGYIDIAKNRVYLKPKSRSGDSPGYEEQSFTGGRPCGHITVHISDHESNRPE